MNPIKPGGTNIQEGAPRGSRESPLAHILLVDDDPLFRSITRLTLVQMGYSVSVAEDAKSALEAAAQDKEIQLVVTDIVLPGMNGVQLARALNGILPGCKVLYISGYSRATLIAGGETADLSHFLQKPFSPAQLGASVKAALGGPQ